jgi:hypothetical protein
MKMKARVLVIIFFAVLVGLVAVACQVKYVNVRYIASEGGVIQGEAEQTVEKGGGASAVTASASTGYYFTEWSDGITDATRTDGNITSDLTVTARFEKYVYEVSYNAGAGGSIEGSASQSVSYGEESLTVTAVADFGYRFVKWSDNVTTVERTDKITKALNVTAMFEKIEITFVYNYNNATDNCSAESVELKYETFDTTIALVVPEKEYFIFNGWFSDKEYTTQITDESGLILLGYEIFDSLSKNLYAKWTVIEEVTYKILMVYVTEIQCVLTTTNGTPVNVYYKMSDIEREVLLKVTENFSNHLNEIFDGLVTFEVDSYFTTQVVGVENFDIGYSYTLQKVYMLFADKLPELNNILDNYRSIIIVFNMNDYDNLLHDAGGSAIKKYACVYMEGLFGNIKRNNISFEELLSRPYTDWYWTPGMLGNILHEFTHTVEMAVEEKIPELYDSFHPTMAYYATTYNINGIPANDLYLLNKCFIDGKYVGIPYSFWKDDK